MLTTINLYLILKNYQEISRFKLKIIKKKIKNWPGSLPGKRLPGGSGQLRPSARRGMGETAGSGRDSGNFGQGRAGISSRAYRPK